MPPGRRPVGNPIQPLIRNVLKIMQFHKSFRMLTISP